MIRRGGKRVMVTMHRSLCDLRERDVVLVIPAGVPVGAMIEGHVKSQRQCVHSRGDPHGH